MTYLELPNLIKDEHFPYRLVMAQDTPDFPEMASHIYQHEYYKLIAHAEQSVTQQLDTLLDEVYLEFQYGLVESTTQRMIAVGCSVPLPWEGNFEDLPDEGWDWACAKALVNQAEGRQPTVLCALGISILPEYRGKSLSQYMIKFMAEIAKFHKLCWLIVPARPTLKHLYPLTPMERYVTWKNEVGLPFDPWVRTHIKQGAKMIGICAKSLTVTDTIRGWETRTDMRFPETGDYIVPKALVPIKIDYAHERGTYIEPNVWLYYDLS